MGFILSNRTNSSNIQSTNFTSKMKFILFILLFYISFSRLVEREELPLSTRGKYIVNAQGRPIKLNCINWYGAHQLDYIVSGPEYNTVENIVNYVVKEGFNCVRFQWSLEMFERNPRITNRTIIAADMKLYNKTALEVYDYILKLFVKERVMVIIDNHILDAEWCCSEKDGNGLWFNKNFTKEKWIQYWKSMVGIYKNEPFVIGVDLKNEPRRVCNENLTKCETPNWGGGGKYDWRLASEECGNAIHSINPNLLIFVEGLNFALDLRYVKSYPLEFKVPNKLVYSVHDYPWFHQVLTSYEVYVIFVDYFWGHLKNDYPIWIGEFGTCHTNSTCLRGDIGNGKWWQFFIRFVKENNLHWCYWALNGSQARGTSRIFGTLETFGLLNLYYNQTSNEILLNDLKSIMN